MEFLVEIIEIILLLFCSVTNVIILKDMYFD